MKRFEKFGNFRGVGTESGQKKSRKNIKLFRTDRVNCSLYVIFRPRRGGVRDPTAGNGFTCRTNATGLGSRGGNTAVAKQRGSIVRPEDRDSHFTGTAEYRCGYRGETSEIIRFVRRLVAGRWRSSPRVP